MKQYLFTHTILICFLCLSFSPKAQVNEPVLARLSFRVPPQQRAAFEAAYPTQIEPILNRHGLVASLLKGRATPDSIFSRLFELKTPLDIAPKQRALLGDRDLRRALRDLGIQGFQQPNRRFYFETYQSPAGPGRRVSAGPGKVQVAEPGTGVWSFLDESDGLNTPMISAGYQDRSGYLWFGGQGGVSRYDGLKWETFTTKDGLASNGVLSIFEDSSGHLWVGTTAGVSRYDPSASSGQATWQRFITPGQRADHWVRAIFEDSSGRLWFADGGVSRYDPNAGDSAWQTFTAQDGLASNLVHAIFEDSSGDLWLGMNRGVSRYDPSASSGQAQWQTFTKQDGLAGNQVYAVFEDSSGHMWFGTDRGVSRYDPSASSGQAAWQTFRPTHDLPSNSVRAIWQDSLGHLWFGTRRGISRYDGVRFKSFPEEDAPKDVVLSIFQDREHNVWVTTVNGVYRHAFSTLQTFTVKDGLESMNVPAVFEDASGHLWFGGNGAMSRFDGTTFTTFTDGLANAWVQAMVEDASGHLWFGGGEAVSRFDPSASSGQATFTTFTAQDGLAYDPLRNNLIRAMIKDASGHLWVGTLAGLSRYDPSPRLRSGQAPGLGQAQWETFAGRDGLVHDGVYSLFQDRSSHLWIGTYLGVSRYDGNTFSTFVDPKGLLEKAVHSIFEDASGHLWFGGQLGVSRYDPNAGNSAWQTFTTQDGLGGGRVNEIFQDASDHLWFATSGGVSRYDGQVFQTMIHEDGLANNTVLSALQDQSGTFWFGTRHGLTRFQPPPASPPPLHIDAVVADQRYAKPDAIQFPNTVPLVRFEFHGVSFKTRPEAMVYRYRLRGYEEEWHTTHERRVEYEALETGSYTFEIQAVDRDLTYSELATVTLSVVPPFYLQSRFLIPVGGAGSVILGVLIFLSVALIRRRREVSQYQQAAVAELGDAREVQLSLLPKSAPQINGFDIAGICEPATEVGGDYFTYCQLNGTSENLGIVLMDVTGHGMRAASTAFMANGMLQSEILSKHSPDEVLTQMDLSLKRVLSKSSFVAVAFAHLNLKDRTLTHYNAGIPEPILWRNDRAVDFNIHNTRPLGGPLNPQFTGTNVALQSGDMILMFSDGLTEATNEAGAMYGEGRLTTFLSTLEGMEENTQAWITAIQQDVQAFVGNGELEDDLTIVGIKVV